MYTTPRELTETIEQFPALIEAIGKLFHGPVGGLALAAFFFWLFINKDFSHLTAIFQRRKSKRLEEIDSYLKNHELTNTDSVKVMRDIRDAHYFQIATGIFAENKLRIGLICLHVGTSYRVNWKQISRAISYIELDANGIVTIRDMKFIEKCEYWFNLAIGCSFLLFSGGLLGLVIFAGNMTVGVVTACIFGFLASLLFAMFVFIQNWPMQAANIIRDDLARVC